MDVAIALQPGQVRPNSQGSSSAVDEECAYPPVCLLRMGARLQWPMRWPKLQTAQVWVESSREKPFVSAIREAQRLSMRVSQPLGVASFAREVLQLSDYALQYAQVLQL